MGDEIKPLVLADVGLLNLDSDLLDSLVFKEILDLTDSCSDDIKRNLLKEFGAKSVEQIEVNDLLIKKANI